MEVNNVSRIVKRGDIFYIDCGVQENSSVQGGVRPCIVIQNNRGNRYSPVVIVAVITSKINKTKLPTHVLIGKECGLDTDSVILLEQIRPIDKNKLGTYLGKATSSIIDKVDKAIQISLEVGEGKSCTMSNEEKVANVKANSVKSIDTTIKELLRENEPLDMIEKYMTKRENRIEELNNYCMRNNLDYKKFYNMVTDNRKIQSK